MKKDVLIMSKDELVDYINQAVLITKSDGVKIRFNPWSDTDEVAIAMAKFCKRVEKKLSNDIISLLLVSVNPKTIDGFKSFLDEAPNIVYSLQIFDPNFIDKEICMKYYEFLNMKYHRKGQKNRSEWNVVTSCPECPETVLWECFANSKGLFGICKNPNVPEELVNKMFSSLMQRRFAILIEGDRKASDKKLMECEQLLKELLANPKISCESINEAVQYLDEPKIGIVKNPNAPVKFVSEICEFEEGAAKICASYELPSETLNVIFEKFGSLAVVREQLLMSANVDDKMINRIISDSKLDFRISQKEMIACFINQLNSNESVSTDIKSGMERYCILRGALHCPFLSNELKKDWAINFAHDMTGSWRFIEEYENERFGEVYDIVAKKIDIEDTGFWSNKYAYSSSTFLDKIVDYFDEVDSYYGLVLNSSIVLGEIKRNIEIIPATALQTLKEKSKGIIVPYWENLISYKLNSNPI